MEYVRGKRSGGLGLEVFDPAPVAVTVSRGPSHRLIYTNAVFQSIFGDRPLGVPIREAFDDLVEENSSAYFTLLDEVLRTGKPVNVSEAPVTMVYSGTGLQERFFTFGLSEIFLDDGDRGVLQVFVEVTAQVTSAQRVQALSEERFRLLQRYKSLGRVGTQMVWVTAATGGVNEPSPGWQKVTGQSWEEFRGDGWLRALHPDDVEPTIASWSRAVEEVTPLWEHVYRLRLTDGTYRHFKVRAVPVREGDVVAEWVGTCADIEQQWQENRRQELLDRATEATADITRLEEMLTALANVIVPELADGCVIYLLPESADRPADAPLVVHRIAGAVRSGLPERPARNEESIGTSRALADVVRHRRPVHILFPPGQPPPGIALADTESWLIDAAANSMVLVPVIVDGTVAAVVSASVCGERPVISATDAALIGQTFDHAHTPLSNAIEFRRTQRVALALQHSLLPDPPVVPDLQIVARYRPSPAAAEVGGDWYDCFLLHDGTTVLTIGDVAGHDLPSAVAMSQIRNMLRGLSIDRQEPPGEILRRLDNAMGTLYSEETATCVLARVERASDRLPRLNYSVAGHPPPLLVDHDGDSRFLDEAPNHLLGLLYDRPRDSAVEPLPPRSTLLLYTDGLVERPGENLGDGLERLRRHAASLAREPLESFCDRLLTELNFGGKDDIAMIALRLPAAPSGDPGPLPRRAA
ncbi:SpoIIE family protein phosphatase [Streptosporangium lutulentum]